MKIPYWDLLKTFLKEVVTTQKKLDQIIAMLKEIQGKEEHMSKELDALEAAVTENISLDQSIIDLVNGLAAQIVSMKDDPVKLQALADSLKAKSVAISEAIQANTQPA